MSYRTNSKWNDSNEIKCLIIFKKLKLENFPRGKQAEFSRELSKTTGLKYVSISAKISNYKSVSGINKSSNASLNTISFYKKYHKLSIKELTNLLS